MSRVLTGDKALDRTLARLADKTAKKIARKAVSAALTVVNRAAKKEAPDKRSRKAIGKRMKRSKGLVAGAKVGVNVGKKKANKDYVAPWLAMGTEERHTDTGENRGRIEGDDYIARSFRTSESAAAAKMKEVVATEIAKGAK
jgi:hypothetical protein